MSNNLRSTLIGIVVVALLTGGAWWFMQNTSHPLPLAEGDTIESWNFQGSYKDGGELEKKANEEISKQKSLLGGDQGGTDDNPTDYVLYVSIANQHQLLGEGRAAYDYLGRALKIDADKTGLAWHNLGVLLERLGAFNTARIGYARAAEAQPNIEEYHIARLRFLLSHFANDASALEAAFGDAEARFGNDAPFLLQLREQAAL